MSKLSIVSVDYMCVSKIKNIVHRLNHSIYVSYLAAHQSIYLSISNNCPYGPYPYDDFAVLGAGHKMPLVLAPVQTQNLDKDRTFRLSWSQSRQITLTKTDFSACPGSRPDTEP